MSIMQATVRARVATLSGSISGSLTASCIYTPPQTSCLASTTLTAAGAGGSGSYTYSWSVVSGAANFTAATNATTAVRRTSSASGAATVRCTISDGVTSVDVDVTINFNHIAGE